MCEISGAYKNFALHFWLFSFFSIPRPIWLCRCFYSFIFGGEGGGENTFEVDTVAIFLNFQSFEFKTQTKRKSTSIQSLEKLGFFPWKMDNFFASVWGVFSEKKNPRGWRDSRFECTDGKETVMNMKMKLPAVIFNIKQFHPHYVRYPKRNVSTPQYFKNSCAVQRTRT